LYTPHISESVIGNLKAVVDWFIEENFSYIRVFRCSIPPHALPKFLPDRLVCREVAHQIITGGIGIELKTTQKKFWPVFPVQIGRFSLLNLGHSKVEAAALEEVKLVNLEHRKHDPYQTVGSHMAHCGMKAFEHEESPRDDIFKGVKTYEEVLDRVQVLSSDLQTSLLTFQRHRRSGLPKVLQGEATTSPPEQENIPPGFGQKAQNKADTEENPQEVEGSSQNKEVPQTENPGVEAEKASETPPESSQSTPPSPSTIHIDTPKTTGETKSTELGNPITSLTPLQSTFGFPQVGVIYASDLDPISREEIPPSDYFFSKKRKVVLKQEMYMREGGMVKKHRVLVDGKNLEEGDFTTEVAGSMGALATTNLFTVSNMRARLEQSNRRITQLQDQLKDTEKNIKEEINKGLEQARAADKQEIQSLKTSLDEMNEKMQTSQIQVIRQEELVRQLQAKLNSIKGQVIDLKVFQDQSLEIHAKIEAEQQKVISQVEIIQNYFQETSNAFDNIIFKEKEAKAARATFQKAVVCSENEEVSKILKLSVTEQIRGDIMLKVWENNIAEYKKIVKEIKDDCERIFDLLDKESLGIGRDNCTGQLGQINIVRHQLNFKEGLNEIQLEISQLKEMDVTLIDKWLVKPNLKFQSIKFVGKEIEDQLPETQRKFYLFEAKDLPESPRNFVHFLEKCIECIRSKEGDTSVKQ
jgi:hypothetical protein